MENPKKYHFLVNLPQKNNRYIIVDTETTGLNQKKDHILEIAAIEINNGELTGNQFHGYLKARTLINKLAENKHKISKDFYDIHIEGYFNSDKNLMQNFIKFAGESIIFAHNAAFDLAFINRELENWNLPTIPLERFRCSMRIAKNILKDIDSELYKKFSLKNCCEYFNIVIDDDNLHNALYDCTLTGKLLNRIYCLIEENKKENECSFFLSRIANGEIVDAKRYKEEFDDEIDEDHESIEKILKEMKIETKLEKSEEMIVKNYCRDDENSKHDNLYPEGIENIKVSNIQIDSKKHVYKNMMKNFINNVDNKK